jgi:membrane protease YdiL (CAAX protease family)
MMENLNKQTQPVESRATSFRWLRRLGLFFLFMLGQALIFIFGAYYFDVFPTNRNLTYSLILSGVFLGLTLWFRFYPKLASYWRIPLAFFIASIAFPLTALLNPWIRTVLGWFNETDSTSRGLAIEKVCEMLIKTVPILLLVRLSGADFGSVYLKRGRWRLGLGIGVLVFLFLGTATFMFAAARFTNPEALAAAVAWGLVFSFANAFMEELWLRGIFLKPYEAVLGSKASVWLTSLIFAALHSFVFYFEPTALIFFFINTLVLGLACGYLIIKTDSLWGAVVIHAASDFFLFVAVLAAA